MEAGPLRLFFGFSLPPDAQDTLGRWQRRYPGIEGWSRSKGLHLTLAFLGQRPDEAPAALEGLAAAVAVRHPALSLSTAGLGSFSRGNSTRLLWLGLTPCPALEAFAGDLRMALDHAQETFDPKPFRSHLTLARFRQARRLAEFADPPILRFAADRLVLFESQPQGGYTPLRAWPLRRV